MKVLYILCICMWTCSVDGQPASHGAKTKENISKGKITIAKKVKNGIIKYFSASGQLDSTVTFKAGKRDGLKKHFLSEYDTFFSFYRNDSLIRESMVGKFNKLRYQSPLDTSKGIKTTFAFSSGRLYYDHTKTDTLTITTTVPELNFYVYFPGSAIINLRYLTFIIKAWQPQSGTQYGKMVTDIFQNVFNNSELLKEEIFYVEIR